MAISNQLFDALESALGSPETRDEIVLILNTEVAGTSANVPSSIVKRDASGNFSAGTITASLNGVATSASSVGGSNAANIHTAELAANAATSSNTPNTIISRDSSGNFSAGTITASLSGNASTATLATTATTSTSSNTVATTQVSSNTTFFPLMVSSSSNSNQAVDLGTGLTFNPSTNTLTTSTFVGALTGAASANVLKAGDTMSGILSMGSNKITNVTDPTLAQDASTKNYTDTVVASSTLTPITSVAIKAAATAASLSESAFYAQTMATAPASDIRLYIQAAIAAGRFDLKQKFINAYDAVHSLQSPKIAKNVERIVVNQSHLNQQFIDLSLSPMSGSARLTLNGTSLIEGGWAGSINAIDGAVISDYQMNYGGKYPTVYNVVNEVSAKERTTVLINNIGSFFDTSGAAGKYFTIDSGSPDSPHYFWFKVTDAGSPATDPAPGGTGFEVDILLADTAAQIAGKLNTVVAAQSTLFTSTVATATVTITNFNIGAVTIATAATSGTTVTRTVLGLNSNLNNNYMAMVGAYASPYATNGGADFLLWFNVDGLGDANTAYLNSQAGYELLLSGIMPIQVNIVSGSTAFTVATAIATAIRQNVPTMFEITEPTATLATTQVIGSITNGSTTITVLSNTGSSGGIAPGMPISGTGIPANTLVVSVSGTSVVLNNAATATSTGVYFTFSYLPIKIYKDEYVLNAVDTHIVPVSTLVNTAARGFNMSSCFQVIGANTFDNTIVEPNARIGFLGAVIPGQLAASQKTLGTMTVPGTVISGSNRVSNISMPGRLAAVMDGPIRVGQFVNGPGIAPGTIVAQANMVNFGALGIFSAKKVAGTRDYAITDANGSPTTMSAYQTYAAANPSTLNGTLATVTTTGDLTYNSPVITNITTTGIVAGMQVQGPYIPFGVVVPANVALPGTLTTGSSLVPMNSIAGIVLGMFVSGTGIPASTSVTAISPGYVTLNNQATTTGVNTLTFTAFGTNTLVLAGFSGPLLGQIGAYASATTQTLLFGSCTSVATQSQTLTMVTGSPYATIATTTPNLAHLMAVTAGTGFPVGATILNVATTYSFTVSPANATVGAVYSNNSFSYVVGSTITGGTTLSASGNGTPLASGTLTLVSGTGDATITFSSKSAASTRLTMNANATVTASNSITFAPSAGSLISGTGIPSGTFVVARSGTTLTLSSIPTVAGVQALSFIPYYPNLTLGGVLFCNTPGMSADQKISGTSPVITRVRTVSGGDIITQNIEICVDSLLYPFSLTNRISTDITLSQPASASATGILSFTLTSTPPLKVGDIITATYDIDDNPIPSYIIEQNVPYAGPTWDGSDATIDTWYKQSAYSFTIPASSVTKGAVYSHNGFNYTARYTTTSNTLFAADGTGTPLSSGTLTKVSGIGPSTLVFTISTQSTITMPYKVKGEGVPILCLYSLSNEGGLDGLPNMAGQMPTGKCYFVSYPGGTRPFGAAVGCFTDAQTSDIQAWNNNSPGNPFSDLSMSSTIRAIGSLVERFNCGPMYIIANNRAPQIARMLCQARPDLFRGMFTGEPFDQSFYTVPYTGAGTSFTPWSSVGISLAGTTTNGSNVVVMGSGTPNYTVGVWNGMPVSGPGIQAGTTVSSFTTTSVTLSLNANASGSAYLLFGGTPSGTPLKSDFFYEYCTSNDLVSSNPNLVTGNITSGSNVITGLTSTKGILKGMSLTGAGINVSDAPVSCSITSGSTTISNISAGDISNIKVGMEVWGGGLLNASGGTNALTLQAQGQVLVLSVGVSSIIVNVAPSITNTNALLWFTNVVKAVTPTTITMTNPAFSSGTGITIRGRMIVRDSNYFKLLTLNENKRRAWEIGIVSGTIKFGRSDNLLTAQAYAGAGWDAWSASASGSVLAPTTNIQAGSFQFGPSPATQADDGTHPNLWFDANTIPFETRVSVLAGFGNAALGGSTGTNACPSFDNGAGPGVDQGSGIYRSSLLSQPFKFWSNTGSSGPITMFFRRSYLSEGEAIFRFINKKIMFGAGSDLPNPSLTQLNNRCQGMTFYRYDNANTWVFMLNPSVLIPVSTVISEATEWALGAQSSFHAFNPFNDTGTSPLTFGIGTYLLNQFVNSSSAAFPGALRDWQQVRNVVKPQN